MADDDNGEMYGVPKASRYDLDFSPNSAHADGPDAAVESKPLPFPKRYMNLAGWGAKCQCPKWKNRKV